MSAIARDQIDRFAVMCCSYNEPLAAIEAYHRFVDQTAVQVCSTATDTDPKARLIVLDSSAKPGPAREFYEQLQDSRVEYHHLMARPNRGRPPHQDVVDYPKAYRWITDPKIVEIYLRTIPDDKRILEEYLKHPDIPKTMKKYDAKVYQGILQHSADWNNSASADRDDLHWHPALREAFTREDNPVIYDRPHLGSKRHFAMELARNHGSQAVAVFDDDYYGPEYVQRRLDALKDADFTGLMQYSALVLTKKMAEEGRAPIWAVSNLDLGGKGFEVERDGTITEKDQVEKRQPMGWSYAFRLGGEHPAPILGGEDTLLLGRMQAAGRKLNIQYGHDDSAVRIVSNGSSTNPLNKILKPFDPEMPLPVERQAALDHFAKIFPQLADSPHSRGARNEGFNSMPQMRAAFSAATL